MNKKLLSSIKVINYPRYFYPQFDCVIKGTVRMNVVEWHKIRAWLQENNLLIDANDVDRVTHTRRGMVLNVRVAPTEALIAKFAPPSEAKKLKRQNYVIEVCSK